MTYSKYQTAIFDAIKNTTDNLVIDAVAGSGKTTTIVEAIKLIPEDQSVLFVAFNKHIAEELKKRIPAHAEAATLNAFGHRIVSKGKRIVLDKNKTSRILEYQFNMQNTTERSTFFKIRGAIERLISLFKANCVYDADLLTPDFITEIADKYGVDLPNDKEFNNYVVNTYASVLSTANIIDFDDQIFRPLFKAMPIPQYDVVMVDEAQDLSPIQRELVMRAGTRIIAVGDTRQAIYGFRGADPDSIPNLIKDISAKVLPLSISYRCPKRVVEAAQAIVPHIEYSETAADGQIEDLTLEKFRERAEDGDYILCRTTAPLVSECLRMIREGKKATVKGRDIGQALVAIIKKISSHAGQTSDDFYISLDRYYLENLERLERARRDAEILALQDRVETIKVLLEASKTVGEIVQRVEEIFLDDATGIIFCTVHKAKGLEGYRIFILKPELMPHPSAKLDWQVVQEMNLKYVAITRVKFDKNHCGELYWVKSKG